MIGTEQEARERALVALAEIESQLGKPLAIWDAPGGPSAIEDHGDVWVVHWSTAAHIRTGSFDDQVFLGPLAIPKDGTEYIVLGTSGTPDEELASWRAAEAAQPLDPRVLPWLQRPASWFTRRREDGSIEFGDWELEWTVSRSAEGVATVTTRNRSAESTLLTASDRHPADVFALICAAEASRPEGVRPASAPVDLPAAYRVSQDADGGVRLEVGDGSWVVFRGRYPMLDLSRIAPFLPHPLEEVIAALDSPDGAGLVLTRAEYDRRFPPPHPLTFEQYERQRTSTGGLS